MRDPIPLSEDRIRRYSRNILLREVGGRGQEKLLAARVLLVGAGGLGSPAGLYLAAAGVGTIGVADGDEVELSNLQRQIAHGVPDLGRDKAASLAEALHRLDPEISVPTHPRVEEGRVPFDDYDLILDCSDNFETRYLVNDEAVRRGLPLVSAAVVRFEGQLTTVLPGEGSPCYRCLYPTPPDPECATSCAREGVLGSAAGTMGTLQATEALKVILGVGRPLAGRLLLYDALEPSVRIVGFRRDPFCRTCGEGKAGRGFKEAGGGAEV